MLYYYIIVGTFKSMSLSTMVTSLSLLAKVCPDVVQLICAFYRQQCKTAILHRNDEV